MRTQFKAAVFCAVLAGGLLASMGQTRITRGWNIGYFTDGTAPLPSMTFGSDPTTGFYLSGSNINVTTGGTARYAITGSAGGGLQFKSDLPLSWSSGNVGSASDVLLLRDAAATLALKNSTNAQKFVMYQTTTGPVKNTLDMTAPTISSGFGTSPAIVAGATAFSFRVNVGTGGVATSGVIGLPTATTGWNCSVQDMTNNTATRQTASTTATATFTAAAAWAASDILVANCISY